MTKSLVTCAVYVNTICKFSTGIECVKCTDACLKGSSTPFVLQHFDSTHRHPECDKAVIDKPDSGVTLQNCMDAPGHDQVNECGRLIGTVNVSIQTQFVDVKDFPIHFLIRGCFIVEKTLRGGCYQDKQIIDQQRGVLSNFFKEIMSLQFGEVDAKLCVNQANNSRTWGTNVSNSNNLSTWGTNASKDYLLQDFLICLCLSIVIGLCLTNHPTR
ncbi:hypothetical protein AM593_09622, partial [Mytilus galloprovincialis]